MKTIRTISILALASLSLAYAHAEELSSDKKAMLGKIAPATAYKYFSGYLENNHNHPAIYAYGDKEGARLVVTGRGFHKVFSMNDWTKAMAAYQSVLTANGYEPGK